MTSPIEIDQKERSTALGAILVTPFTTLARLVFGRIDRMEGRYRFIATIAGALFFLTFILLLAWTVVFVYLILYAQPNVDLRLVDRLTTAFTSLLVFSSVLLLLSLFLVHRGLSGSDSQAVSPAASPEQLQLPQFPKLIALPPPRPSEHRCADILDELKESLTKMDVQVGSSLTVLRHIVRLEGRGLKAFTALVEGLKPELDDARTSINDFLARREASQNL